jgi:hypothetical protein
MRRTRNKCKARDERPGSREVERVLEVSIGDLKREGRSFGLSIFMRRYNVFSFRNATLRNENHYLV